MARRKPPQHRADTPGIFIPKNDSSFDVDRFDKEMARMEEEGLDKAQHPIERYYSGETRYDLSATEDFLGETTTAGSYFDSSKDPERFTLRRLDWDQWHRVMGLIEAGAFGQAQLLACRYGISEVQNSPLKLSGAASGMLSHEDMQRLFDADPALPSALGFAVWKYSRPLTDQEKKA